MRLPCVFTLLVAISLPALAEKGILVVQVKNAQGLALAGVEIGTEGDGGQAVTDQFGKARIKLAPQTKPNSWVTLQIVMQRDHNGIVMVSPWDGRCLVPSFENESDNYVRIVVAARGDRAMLESGTVLIAMAEKLNKANAAKDAALASDSGKIRDTEVRQHALAEVASEFGLQPSDVESALKDWGARTTDPYQKGLVQLFNQNYSEASKTFSKSLELRKKRAEADSSAVADAAFSLGISLYNDGRYQNSVSALGEALNVRPNDSRILRQLSKALFQIQKYANAEEASRRALQVDEAEHAPGTVIATDFNNLGVMLQGAGKLAEAEENYGKALEVAKRASGPDSLETAAKLDNLGTLFTLKGDYGAAERVLRTAVDISEKNADRSSASLGTRYINLAYVFRNKGKLTDAETLCRKAISTDTQALGPEDPMVAMDLNSLGLILAERGNYADAENLIRQSRAILEKRLGPQNPLTASEMTNLGGVLATEGKFTEASQLFEEALGIQQKMFGAESPAVVPTLNGFATIYRERGDLDRAEKLCRSILAIDQKSLGEEHPEVATDLNNLADILLRLNRQPEAEEFLKQALRIEESSLGQDSPVLAATLNNLASVAFSSHDYQNAEKLQRKAIAIEDKVLGPSSPILRSDITIWLYTCMLKETIRQQ